MGYEDYDRSGFQKLGSYCWLEIPALDLTRASKFYTALFGWNFAPPSAMGLPDDGTTLIFSKKHTATHGAFQLVKDKNLLIAPQDSVKEQAVRITMSVESVDETLKLVEQEGGEVLEGRTLVGGGMGSKGVLKDPEGNVIGVIESHLPRESTSKE